ncbi:MAG: hypothetical protein BRD41_00365 [Bacteroidetes bacterium QS_1_63_11]|nr:MAG: hypothetical protein BRD41_00365 [Bacteroidetes bacterium QS_1_63_11]
MKDGRGVRREYVDHHLKGRTQDIPRQRTGGRTDASVEGMLILTRSGWDLNSKNLASQSRTSPTETNWSQVETAGSPLRLDDPPCFRYHEDRLQWLSEALFHSAVEHRGRLRRSASANRKTDSTWRKHVLLEHHGRK